MSHWYYMITFIVCNCSSYKMIQYLNKQNHSQLVMGLKKPTRTICARYSTLLNLWSCPRSEWLTTTQIINAATCCQHFPDQCLSPAITISCPETFPASVWLSEVFINDNEWCEVTKNNSILLITIIDRRGNNENGNWIQTTKTSISKRKI